MIFKNHKSQNYTYRKCVYCQYNSKMLYLNIQHGFLYMIIMQGSDMWRHVEPVPLT